jgi:hypothetical protein
MGKVILIGVYKSEDMFTLSGIEELPPLGMLRSNLLSENDFFLL